MNTVSNYDLKIKKRIQLVHIAAIELGLLDPKKHETDPDDDYHTILKRWNRPGTRQQVTSSLQMNYEQLGELLDFFKALGFRLRRKEGSNRLNGSSRSNGSNKSNDSNGSNQNASWKKFESSLAGLKQEICNLAWVRWGGIKPGPGVPPDEVWEAPLNNFCQRFGVKRWQWMDVNHGKAVKGALLRLQNTDDRAQAEPEDEEPIPF